MPSFKQEWIDKNEKKQNEAKPSENPVLLVKDIEAKQGKLDRELVYLLNKAKYYVPKPKVNETGTNHVLFVWTPRAAVMQVSLATCFACFEFMVNVTVWALVRV